MSGSSFKAFAAVFCAFLVLGFTTTNALAEWTLYDDFSSAEIDWSGKWAYGKEGPNTDIVFSVSDGKLRIVKSSGSAITSDNGRRCRIVADALPAEANGLKMDVSVVSISGPDAGQDDLFRMTYRFQTQGGVQDGLDLERATEVETFITNLASTPSLSLAADMAYWSLDDSIDEDPANIRIPLDADDFQGGWATFSAQQNPTAGYVGIDLEDNEDYYVKAWIPDADETGMSNPTGMLRIDQATAATTFVIEVDNVYYHTGEFESAAESAAKTKCVVIPMF